MRGTRALSRRSFLVAVGATAASTSIAASSRLDSETRAPIAAPDVIGHRGCAGIEPPNTIRGIRTAIDLGVDGVELDVRRTADGELVLFHDPILDWSTDHHGIVHETPAETIEDARVHGEPIPTLAEGLDVVSESDVRLYLELKRDGYAAAVLDALDAFDLRRRTTLVSFRSESLAAAADATVDVGALGNTPNPTVLDVASDVEAEYAISHYVPRALPWFINETRERGVRAGIWSLVDVENNVVDAIDHGPDLITTDRPDIALEYRRSRARRIDSSDEPRHD
ncbi:glycerophosphodiester phosphodiesterase [Halegenticoccus tardaugens]|uniref:glycerophosphodiester phosphodiesterase n=1 Tax=Halegenticoccus tardaugens TaxID=2071624 RepID=UPI00100B4369|nr:glycerophosphodiester phosphodiesterase family protein [Halegenticoccus tardaugens]